MDSAGEESTLGSRMMPFGSILGHDLRGLWSGWLVRLWLAGTVVLTFLLTVGNWGQFRDGPLIASVLFPYLVFPWFFVVVVLGVQTVSGSQAEALADGILSRPIGRLEYLFATWLARVVLVLGIFLVVVVPFIAVIVLAKRPVPEDHVTVFGVLSTLFVVALVLTFLVTLGFLAGIVLHRAMLAVVVLVFVWYPIGLILNTFSLEEFSPISLSRALATQLREPLHANGDAEPDEVGIQEAEDLSRQVDHFLSVFSGVKPDPKPERPQFFEGRQFDDFSVFRVLLGYGLPTLVALGLTAVCFYRRDL